MWWAISSPPLLFRISGFGAGRMLLTNSLLQKILTVVWLSRRTTPLRLNPWSPYLDCLKAISISAFGRHPPLLILEPYWKCNISSLELLLKLPSWADFSCVKDFFKFLNWLSKSLIFGFLPDLLLIFDLLEMDKLLSSLVLLGSAIVDDPSSRTWSKVGPWSTPYQSPSLLLQACWIPSFLCPSLVAPPSGRMLSPAMHCPLGPTMSTCPGIGESESSSLGTCCYP